MSGRRREGISPNLFPFLAVLVCTLGTLILLLALVAENAGEAIASTTQAEPAGPDPDLPDPAELAAAAEQIDRQLREARWHREQTVKMREEQTADLEQRRDRLAHLEDHIRRLREELESLSVEVDRSQDSEASGDVGQAQQTLDRLLIEIEQEKGAIAELQEELQTQTPRIVIVPHKGPNGTDRRPIYIECRHDGVYLQPGNLRIPSAHLDSQPGFPNPLEAALRTIRHHALHDYQDAVAPYPLLVVRPDGIATYAAARSAMQGWDDQFGYELLPGDVELAFPPSDSALDSKVAATIRQSIDRRNAMFARLGGRGGSGRGGAGSAGGGRATAFPYGSLVDEANGGATRPHHGLGTSPSDSGSAFNGAEATGDAARSAPIGSENAGDDLGVVAGGGRPTGDAGASGNGLGDGSREGAGMSSSTDRGVGTGATEGLADMGQTGIGQTGIGQTGDGQRDSGSPDLGTPGTGEIGAVAANRSVGVGEPGFSAAGGDPAGSMDGSRDASRASPAGSSPGSAGSQQDGPQEGWALADATAGGSATGSASGTAQGGSAASASASGGPGGPQASGAANMDAEEAQSMSGSPSVDFQSASPPPVTRVGRDWALPPQTNSGPRNEVLRMIRVECHADRFVLLPEGGRGEPRSYPFPDGDVQRAAIAMATDIRERVRHWGASVPNSRWQPVLEVAVGDGAQLRYSQLQRLYEGSGLLIQTRENR
ncbi:MAG: hypothetical protein EA381_10200 [Planctomycetaceae bacterium]|nr:MAG: hypothetical protein EA381_10200 [Planctomycetaceae bacterium]